MNDYETDIKQVNEFYENHPECEDLRKAHISIVECLHFLKIDPTFLKDMTNPSL